MHCFSQLNLEAACTQPLFPFHRFTLQISVSGVLRNTTVNQSLSFLPKPPGPTEPPQLARRSSPKLHQHPQDRNHWWKSVFIWDCDRSPHKRKLQPNLTTKLEPRQHVILGKSQLRHFVGHTKKSLKALFSIS
jgi:hypothetical protein